jgi:hypothetical protein
MEAGEDGAETEMREGGVNGEIGTVLVRTEAASCGAAKDANIVD